MAGMESYTVVGTKEDVSDVITMISPTKTPFLSSIGTRPVHNKIFEWQEDALNAVGAHGHVEGADAPTADQDATVMRSGYTQMFMKTVSVSGTADAQSYHGRKKEFAYQMSKAGAELKRDLEHALVGLTQTATAGNNSSTARLLTSVSSQVASGNITLTGGTSTAPSEANLLTALNDCFTAGSDPNIVMVTADDAIVVSDFAKASGRYRTINQDGKTLVSAIDLYVSPFGEVKVVINRFLRSADTLVYDNDMWKLAVLRNWSKEPLAKTGDAEKAFIIGEYGLQHSHQSASAVIRKAAP